VNEDVPVLLVGGSLVGLSTAVFLGHHGVPSLVLERRDFVVLAGSDGESWCASARAAGTSLGVPVAAYCIGADVAGDAGRLEALYGTGPGGAVLVRPDGFVAWRASAPHPGPEGDLAGALPSALARRPAAG
jgi:putative polyketide hydroxylase